MQFIKLTQLKELPEKNGIYLIFSDVELIYVGKSQNIKRRIKQHLSPSTPVKIINPTEVKFIAYQIIETQEDTEITENNLLFLFNTKYNQNWYSNQIPLSKEEEKKFMEVEL